jgi:hypothetical protein
VSNQQDAQEEKTIAASHVSTFVFIGLVCVTGAAATTFSFGFLLLIIFIGHIQTLPI